MIKKTNVKMVKMVKIVIILFFLFGIIIAISSCFTGKKKVEGFSDTNANSTANSNANVRMFYVDWCGHCKTTKPEYTKFMDKYNNTQINGKPVNIEMINCDENKEVASQFGVKGYPTIIGTVNGENHTYNGSERTADALYGWLTSIM